MQETLRIEQHRREIEIKVVNDHFACIETRSEFCERKLWNIDVNTSNECYGHSRSQNLTSYFIALKLSTAISISISLHCCLALRLPIYIKSWRKCNLNPLYPETNNKTITEPVNNFQFVSLHSLVVTYFMHASTRVRNT